ncbi:hypothetical protein EVAR_38100_1 [Eumeta japonica]|uniref:Uncharacterized protein n=1 Tax=Eumeta variegata TaxID=151549 RepID=A0A4C1WB16_EUMVA|nr:hypothetical protein EVAR_38100_1 [Eumeta japonica]
MPTCHRSSERPSLPPVAAEPEISSTSLGRTVRVASHVTAPRRIRCTAAVVELDTSGAFAAAWHAYHINNGCASLSLCAPAACIYHRPQVEYHFAY